MTISLDDGFAEKVFNITTIADDLFKYILEESVNLGYRDIYLAYDDYIRVRKDNFRLIASNRKLTTDEVRMLGVQLSSENEVSLTQAGFESGGRFTMSRSDNENELMHCRYSMHQISDNGQSGLDIAIRPIKDKAPHHEEIGIPEELLTLVRKIPQGLILMIGSTGTGKTSTLASLIRYILEQPSHMRILEFARPPEFSFNNIEMHPSNTIKHSEIAANSSTGGDLKTYELANALTMRKAADWITIGEMTEKESFKSALSLSNTGHRVSSTTHANDVAGVFPRVYQMFDADEREYQLFSLINEGQLFCAQQLLDRKGGGLIAVREILIVDQEARSRLLAAKNIQQVHRITSLILSERKASFRAQGMQLLADGLITRETYDDFVDFLPLDHQMECVN
ncbi:ATPase, T2SS/T4P/T4SS family [Vibrio sp. R78045]|uniref:ATPase, T2SS/T4P/T4SS family n=1 Tax=Vibrio sp. R78045 TaxID=3093868 RepID=UPI0036F2844C